MPSDKIELLRSLPKIDEYIDLLHTATQVDAPYSIVKNVVKKLVQNERDAILSGGITQIRDRESWLDLFEENIRQAMLPNLKRILNGTGVVIHTNLGRSVLSENTTKMLAQVGNFYSNLEFNLDNGKRGSRYSLVEEILCELTGAEAALVVNNNAAAVLIALDTFVKNREVIVSRGQLVEIGGSFRIPDVMAKSGARLVEVGATNRTHLEDYKNAINEETKMLLRVHTSNYRIIGFTSDISPEEMVGLAKKHNLISMEDLGSGSLIDFSRYGFPAEPTVQQIVSAGVDIVTFSGDKLLGGPQAGIIVGSRDTIDKIKKNPLNRALRVDKFTLAALEAVLREYYDLEKALCNVPTLRMLTLPEFEVKKRAQKIIRRLKNKKALFAELSLLPTMSRVGGGALPEHNISSWAVGIVPKDMKISDMERKLRQLPIPVIGRIEDEKFLLDVRTIRDSEIVLLTESLVEFFMESGD